MAGAKKCPAKLGDGGCSGEGIGPANGSESSGQLGEGREAAASRAGGRDTA